MKKVLAFLLLMCIQGSAISETTQPIEPLGWLTQNIWFYECKAWALQQEDVKAAFLRCYKVQQET